MSISEADAFVNNPTEFDTTPIGDLNPIQEPDLSNPINDPSINFISSDLNFLQIDERAYKYIRQFSIKNLVDGVVELITNSDDAYRRGQLPNPHQLLIQYSDVNHSLHVVDQATGLRADKMAMCFLQVGKFTSSETSRGFFSRGAKDVSILGDVYFESIQDNYYSKCVITNNAYGAMLVEDEPVTQEIRSRVGIQKNGLHVTIIVAPTYCCNNVSNLMRGIENRATLRKIMADPANIINFQYFDISGDLIIDERLKYVYPSGNIILDLTYGVPNYEGVTARWLVYRADNPIPQPAAENEMGFGFLITSYKSTVHEVSTLDQRFRWNPYINFLYGTLECDYLIELLYDIDKSGVSLANPNVVVDPSRYTGLNRDHPFIMSLLSIPLIRLDKILRDLDSSISRNSVQLDDFNEILKEIEQYGLQLFSDLPQKLQWTQSYNQELVKAILDDRVNYVQLERSFDYVYVDPTYKIESNDWVVVPNSSIMNQIKASATPTSSGANLYANTFYAINDSGEVIGINTNIDITSINFNPQDLKQFYADLSSQIDISMFTQHPYIYSITENGDMIKLYIFESGQIGTLTDSEQNTVNDSAKVINILFTRDTNLFSRYTIDLSSGVVEIRINLNNPIIEQYLVSANASQGADIDPSEVTIDMSSLSKIGNNKSYIFLSELFTEIFAKIILIGKSRVGSIFIDGDEQTKVNKVYAQHEMIVTTIEKPINTIFMNYYKQNSIKMINDFTNSIAKHINDKSIIASLQDILMVQFVNLL
jgi:hypothetical protein